MTLTSKKGIIVDTQCVNFVTRMLVVNVKTLDQGNVQYQNQSIVVTLMSKKGLHSKCSMW